MKALLALLLAILFASALFFGGAWLLGLDGPALERRIWQVQTQIFGPEEVGIFQGDPRLGWRHLPNSEGRQREVPDFDVRYHIDGFGNRRTPGAPEPGTPALIFLGGSFTFGHGVEDAETYPALLQQRWPEVRIVNTATNGWGTAQALLSLDEHLNRESPVAGVVYAFISNHLARNHRRLPWLKAVDSLRGRRNPYFELEGDKLVFGGLAGPEQGIALDPQQQERERRITAALTRELARRCAEREIPFAVVYLPDGTKGPVAPLLAGAVGHERLIDLRNQLRYPRMHFAHDSHLRPDGHRQVAAALAPLLSERMQLPLSGKTRSDL